MFDDEVWEWIVDHANGDFDHLLIGTTVPFLLSPTFHHLEAWNERLCDGACGGLAAKASEKLRRALDFDHWAAFEMSFHRMRRLLEEVGSGKRGKPPASIVILSGDVHHAYLFDVAFKKDAGVESRVVQAVCSPYRNPARRQRAPRRADRLYEAGRGRRTRTCAAGGRTRPRHSLALPRGSLLRQPGGDRQARRSQLDRAARQDHP